MADEVQLTPEIKIKNDETYIIRIDGEIVGCVFNHTSAVLAIDSLVAYEVKRMTNEWTKVLREDLKDGQKVVLSTQSLGRLYNSTVTKAMEFDFIKAPTLHVVKARQSLPKPSLPIPIPPPPPPMRMQEEIKDTRYKTNSLPGDESEDESDSEDSDSEYYDDSDYVEDSDESTY